MKKTILIILLIILVGCNKTLTTNDIKNIIKNEDVIIIDVRSEEEYNNYHIKNSININVNNINKIEINKDKKILLYCQSGSRSKISYNILKELGYKNIIDMGKIEDYKELIIYE